MVKRTALGMDKVVNPDEFRTFCRVWLWVFSAFGIYLLVLLAVWLAMLLG